MYMYVCAYIYIYIRIYIHIERHSSLKLSESTGAYADRAQSCSTSEASALRGVRDGLRLVSGLGQRCKTSSNSSSTQVLKCKRRLRLTELYRPAANEMHLQAQSQLRTSCPAMLPGCCR